MINHTPENIDSLSTTRLFFKSKLIRCKQIAYSDPVYSVQIFWILLDLEISRKSLTVTGKWNDIEFTFAQ